MNKVLSAVMIISALTLAIVPIFTDCQSQGKALTLQDGRSVPMKCHWTGIAEIGVAIPLGVSGIMALRKQRKETTRSLAVVGGVSGILAVLFPTTLIGVCANAMMTCHLIMLPTLVTAGTIATVASFALFVNAREPEIPVAGAAA